MYILGYVTRCAVVIVAFSRRAVYMSHGVLWPRFPHHTRKIKYMSHAALCLCQKRMAPTPFRRTTPPAAPITPGCRAVASQSGMAPTQPIFSKAPLPAANPAPACQAVASKWPPRLWPQNGPNFHSTGHRTPPPGCCLSAPRLSGRHRQCRLLCSLSQGGSLQ